MSIDARTLVVGIEDLATAGIVAVKAAHVAMEHDITTVVLLHVLDVHPVLNAMFGMGNYAAPVVETREDGERVLALADAALRAEYAATNRQAPTIAHEIADGDAGRAIERVATTAHAVGIVLGVRRPHAFGRLTHPDVRAHVAGRAACPLYLAPLQASAEEQSDSR